LTYKYDAGIGGPTVVLLWFPKPKPKPKKFQCPSIAET